MAKRILFVVMCALLLTVLIMTAVVMDRVMPILVALSGGFDINFGGSTTESAPTTESTPTTEQTEPSEPSDPSVPTEPSEPTQPSVPTEPTEPAHTHAFTKYVRGQQATCIYTGYSIYACECGQTKMMDIVDALGHNYSTEAAKEPTCTESGCKKACTHCGDVLKADVLAAIGHDYQPTENYVAATCEQKGVDEQKCVHCGDMTWSEIEALGHSGEWVVTQEPGNGEPGVETLENCANCGQTITRPAVMTITGQSPEDLGDYIRYTICVGTTNTPQAFTYIISDYSKSQNLLIRWTENGLNVTYNEANSVWVKTLGLQETELTINAEGKVGPVETPEVPSNPSEPSEPVEESQPSEPSEPVEESQPSEPVEESQPSEPSEPVEESKPSEPTQE